MRTINQFSNLCNKIVLYLIHFVLRTTFNVHYNDSIFHRFLSWHQSCNYQALSGISLHQSVRSDTVVDLSGLKQQAMPYYVILGSMPVQFMSA